jgi:hypothetical protein
LYAKVTYYSQCYDTIKDRLAECCCGGKMKTVAAPSSDTLEKVLILLFILHGLYHTLAHDFFSGCLCFHRNIFNC